MKALSVCSGVEIGGQTIAPVFVLPEKLRGGRKKALEERSEVGWDGEAHGRYPSTQIYSILECRKAIIHIFWNYKIWMMVCVCDHLCTILWNNWNSRERYVFFFFFLT